MYDFNPATYNYNFLIRQNKDNISDTILAANSLSVIEAGYIQMVSIKVNSVLVYSDLGINQNG